MLKKQKSSEPVLKRKPIFYGWWIVGGAWLIQSLNGGLFFNAFQLYFTHLRDEFSWTRSQVVLAFSLSRAESGLLGPIQGWLVDKFGTRVVVMGGTIVMAAGFFSLSRMDTLMSFYGSYLIISLGSSLGGFITVNAALANWFDKKRTKAMGLASTGWGMSGFAVMPLVTVLEIIGWRETAFWSGIIVLIIGLPVSLLMRHAPEPYGYLPDGVSADEDNYPAEDTELSRVDDEVNFTTKEALKSPAFWYLSFGHATALVAVAGINALFIPHLVENIGISAKTGAAIWTLLTAVMVIGQASIGFWGDGVNKRKLIVACMMGHTVALILLATAKTIPFVIVFAILHGLSWGFRGPLMTSIRADYFGRSSFGKIMGWSSMIIQIGTTIGPLIGGFIGDAYGSYAPAFWVYALFTALGAFLFYLAKHPVSPSSIIKT